MGKHWFIYVENISGCKSFFSDWFNKFNIKLPKCSLNVILLFPPPPLVEIWQYGSFNWWNADVSGPCKFSNLGGCCRQSKHYTYNLLDKVYLCTKARTTIWNFWTAVRASLSNFSKRKILYRSVFCWSCCFKMFNMSMLAQRLFLHILAWQFNKEKIPRTSCWYEGKTQKGEKLIEEPQQPFQRNTGICNDNKFQKCHEKI